MTLIRKYYLLLVSLLAGCSSYEVDFDCPTGKGLTCASLSEVNRQIDLGSLGEEDFLPGDSLKREASCSVSESCSQASSLTRSDVLFYHPPQKRATGEVIPGRYARVRRDH